MSLDKAIGANERPYHVMHDLGGRGPFPGGPWVGKARLEMVQRSGDYIRDMPSSVFRRGLFFTSLLGQKNRPLCGGI